MSTNNLKNILKLNTSIGLSEELKYICRGFGKKLHEMSESIFFRRGNLNINLIDDVDFVNDYIGNMLSRDEPLMISRLGGTELWGIRNYLMIKKSRRSLVNYLIGSDTQWWWDEKLFQQIQNWSGFFPANAASLSDFAEQYLNDIKEIDVIGWYDSGLTDVYEYFNKNIVKVAPVCLEPYHSLQPWTKSLEGKRVLVIHPFSETIESQYGKRNLLFRDSNFLPTFDILTIKAVQSLGGLESNAFDSWFSALEFMKQEIDKVEFDICLVGCGAYGLPLAAHVKRKGKKVFHIGGSLQLLFGIKGGRWDKSGLYNEHWVRPKEQERPSGAQNVEDACYW